MSAPAGGAPGRPLPLRPRLPADAFWHGHIPGRPPQDRSSGTPRGPVSDPGHAGRGCACLLSVHTCGSPTSAPCGGVHVPARVCRVSTWPRAGRVPSVAWGSSGCTGWSQDPLRGSGPWSRRRSALCRSGSLAAGRWPVLPGPSPASPCTALPASTCTAPRRTSGRRGARGGGAGSAGSLGTGTNQPPLPPLESGLPPPRSLSLSPSSSLFIFLSVAETY